MKFTSTLLLIILPFLFHAQSAAEFEGNIRSTTLSGSGDRNVVADPNGTLKIGNSLNSLPVSPVKGEMVYYDGTNWQTVPPGTNGQTLTICNCIPTWGPCPVLNIGDTYAGGIIFYLDPSGQGGLVAANTDVPQAIWGCHGTDITGAEGEIIGTGNQNTQDILAGCTTPDIAADLCTNFISNGFSDWYLPSIDELSEMYYNIGQGATGANNNIGGFTSFDQGRYGSSTEGTPVQCRIISFATGSGASSSGGSAYLSKNGTLNVRPIRAF